MTFDVRWWACTAGTGSEEHRMYCSLELLQAFSNFGPNEFN